MDNSSQMVAAQPIHKQHNSGSDNDKKRKAAAAASRAAFEDRCTKRLCTAVCKSVTEQLTTGMLPSTDVNGSNLQLAGNNLQQVRPVNSLRSDNVNGWNSAVNAPVAANNAQQVRPVDSLRSDTVNGWNTVPVDSMADCSTNDWHHSSHHNQHSVHNAGKHAIVSPEHCAGNGPAIHKVPPGDLQPGNLGSNGMLSQMWLPNDALTIPGTPCPSGNH